MAASEPGDSERSTARAASQLSARLADSAVVISSPRRGGAAVPSFGLLVPESAISSPLAGRFTLERIRPP